MSKSGVKWAEGWTRITLEIHDLLFQHRNGTVIAKDLDRLEKRYREIRKEIGLD